MTREKFLEDVVAGGYGEPNGVDWLKIGYPIYINGRRETFEHVILNPKAWEAVGKAEGWDEGELVIDYRDGHNPWDSNWKLNMHYMIDYLCEGKTIDEALESL